MTRKDELEERATKFFDVCDRYTYHDGRKALRDMFLQVERECWEKIINEIEQSGNTRLEGWKNWCRDRLKDVEG